MKMRFIKQNLLLGDGVLGYVKIVHPPLFPISTSSMQRFKGGGLNLTSNNVSFLILSFFIKSFPL